MLVSALVFDRLPGSIHRPPRLCGKARVVEELQGKLARGKEKRAALRAALSETRGESRYPIINATAHLDSRSRSQDTSSL